MRKDLEVIDYEEPVLMEKAEPPPPQIKQEPKTRKKMNACCDTIIVDSIYIYIYIYNWLGVPQTVRSVHREQADEPNS